MFGCAVANLLVNFLYQRKGDARCLGMVIIY